MAGKNVKARAMMYKSKEMKKWELNFQKQLLQFSNPHIIGKFDFQVTVYFNTDLSDLDGMFKGVLDVLESMGWIENDRHCRRIFAEKRVDALNPRIYFKLKTVDK